jgi:hypothetical protein
VILMFSNEGAHAVGHFHARYDEHKAPTGFDGTLIAGELPAAQLRLVGRGRSDTARSSKPTGTAPASAKDSKQSILSPTLLTMADVPPLYDVTGVAVIGDHRLRLLFEDGTVGDVSFEDHPWTGVFEPLAGGRGGDKRRESDAANPIASSGTSQWE